MTDLLSEPIENLIQDEPCDVFKAHCDALIVGSGYGGAIAAMKLAASESAGSVYVFERGKEYVAGDFPETVGDLPAHIQFLRKDRDLPIGYADALFDFRLSDPVSVLVGSGLGGGSLINANVAMEPDDALFQRDEWPGALRSDMQRLRESFREVRHLLGVQRYGHEGSGPQHIKYEALGRLAAALGKECHPAPLTVTTKEGDNVAGIRQPACIGCGNCVTGCNTGSKNTLTMNALPLAKRYNARIFTGATVLTVEPHGAADGSQGWEVRFRRTAVGKTVLYREVFALHATVVVLAAGTLGSTEILLRSNKRAPNKMAFSAQLGKRFSTNGDVVAFGYAQERSVNAVACPDADSPLEPLEGRGIGPTITGFFVADADVKDDKEEDDQKQPPHRVTIEDGAVPSALVQAFGEMVATASLAKHSADNGTAAWFRKHQQDPLAVHPGALRHSQVLLGMADDGAPWKMVLDRGGGEDQAAWDGARVLISPPDGPPPDVFERIDGLLERLEKNGGFDGGDYLPNPLWKLLPKKLTDVSQAAGPGGQVLTVHPLGGCPMGDDIDRGVVDHYGRVFRPTKADPSALYEGLYVMDGAILPCALGVNPFLTIAALAHRNAQAVEQFLDRKHAGLTRSGANSRTQAAAGDTTLECGGTPVERQSARPSAPTQRVSATFAEHMIGRLLARRVPRWLIKTLGHQDRTSRLNEKNKLTLSVVVDVADVLAWVRAPNTPLTAHVRLYANDGPTDPVRDEYLCELAKGCGRVELLAWDRPRWWVPKLWRPLSAILAFLIRRGRDVSEAFKAGRSHGGGRQALCAFWHVAKNHANWRHLAYDFTLETSTGTIRLQGTKQLAYGLWKKDPWNALMDLPITVRGRSWWHSVRGLLRVDLVRLTQRAPFQIVQAPDTPVALAAMAGAGLFLLRVLFQTHFWSFRAPDYPKTSPIADRIPGRIRLTKDGSLEPQFIPLRVRTSRADPTEIELRLLRYKPNRCPRGSILLVHGLAHSSLVFALKTIDVNMVAYLCREGYDVWLLDYRLSIAFPHSEHPLSERQWTMDQIAEYDMQAAVSHIYNDTGAPIQVFAHCIGAGAIAMAILSGRCYDTHNRRSMISALALHAVYPWVVPSPVNEVKANLAAFLRDAIRQDTLNAVVPVQDAQTATDVMLDRIAGSLPWSPAHEALRHRADTDHRAGRPICDRMTLFYGTEWKHTNLAHNTHKELADLVGIGNIETFRQIYFLLRRRRLLDREGANRYVTTENFKQYWGFPTFFTHGNENGLYRPESALAAAVRLRTLRAQTGAATPADYDVYWHEVPGYGHMDFLFGKKAHRDVYPHLDAFFRRVQGAERRTLPRPLQKAWNDLQDSGEHLVKAAGRDPYWNRRPKQPTCGPILGCVRKDGDDVIVRLWVEPYRFSAITAGGQVVNPSGFRITSVMLPNPKGRYYPGTYWIYDIALPAGFDQDLHIAIEYSDDRPDVRLLIEAVPMRQDARATDELQHASQGVTIPLARAPWLRRWHEQKQHSHTGVAFLVGSCRYPGSPFDENLADGVFQAMCRHIPESGGRVGIDHVLLVGDQIYADATADLFDTRDLRERFAERYREAFTASHMRRLLASAPVYMALDDHEFDDNWHGKIRRLQKDPVEQRYMQNFRHGFAAAKAYQWSMSPRDGWPCGLWYTFNSGGLPFFVMDTRTERELRRHNLAPERTRLVSNKQLKALTNWLSQVPTDQPKFIVSGSVLAPIPRRDGKHKHSWRNLEGWAGYPATWRALVKYIVEHDIQDVVFIAGDYHLSALAELTFFCANKRPVRAYQIIASGLFAPLPFANAGREAYKWGIRDSLPWSDHEISLEVQPYLLSRSMSHFMRVETVRVERTWTMRVGIWDGDKADGHASAPEMSVGSPFSVRTDNVVEWAFRTEGVANPVIGESPAVPIGAGS